MDSLFTNVQ